MDLFLDILSLTFILLGALLAVSTALGVVRFRDTVSRMHASSKPQTMGLALTLIGVILHIIVHGDLSIQVRGDLGMLVLIMLFALMTAPVIGNRISHVAKREGLIDREALSRDDEATPNKR